MKNFLTYLEAQRGAYTKEQALITFKTLGPRLEEIDDDIYDQIADEFTKMISPMFRLIMSANDRQVIRRFRSYERP